MLAIATTPEIAAELRARGLVFDHRERGIETTSCVEMMLWVLERPHVLLGQIQRGFKPTDEQFRRAIACSKAKERDRQYWHYDGARTAHTIVNTFT